MIYAKINDEQIESYPLTEVDIKKQHPNVSFPIPFSPPEGYVKVKDTPRPLVEDHTKGIIENELIYVDGLWERSWSIVEADPEVITARVNAKALSIREKRNNILASTDWTQLQDVIIDVSAWQAYRQALRDIANQPTFPWEVVWPTPPQ